MKVDMWNRASSVFVILLWSLSISYTLESTDLNQLSSEGPTELSSVTSNVDSLGNRHWTTGVWSPWSSWSECSRSCGRGVATQTRTCQQESEYLKIRRMRHSRIHGSNQFANTKRCLGVFRRFQLCHNKPCEELVDMRREQCVAFNKKPFYGTLYQWEPFVKDPSRCELQCRPLGQRFYATLAKVVEDGTPCSDPLSELNEDKICVAGQCKPVGCEGVIGSTRQWDRCGVCHGNGTTCRPVSGFFTRPVLSIGYNLIAVLPPGARNIRITEMTRSRNFLALLGDDGSSVLNGNWSIGRSGEYPGVNTVFTYRRQSETGSQGQIITAPGPIDKPIHLMLIYQQRNSGIRYSYSLPVRPQSELSEAKVTSSYVKVPKQRGQNSTKLPKNPKHRWKNRNKHERKKSNGSQTVTDSSGWPVAGGRNASKVLRSSTSSVEYQRRGPVDRTTIPEPFNVYSQRDVLNDVDVATTTRDIHWKMIGFSDCSKTCGGGRRLAAAACFSERHKAIVGDLYCQGQQRPPDGQLPCNTEPCPGPWTVGEWSECSTSCGEGKQVRKVTCEGDARLCTAQEAPPTARPCNLKPCHRWETSDWGQCSTSCGPGVRHRRVQCVSEQTRDASDPSLCEEPRPSDESPCKSSRPCPSTSSTSTTTTTTSAPLAAYSQSEWLTTEWDREDCRKQDSQDPCGQKLERRHVLCARVGHPAQDSACSASSRPASSQPCGGVQRPDCQGEWFTGPWSNCPEHGCSTVQRRSVVCLSRTSERNTLTDDFCRGLRKPETERKCRQDCPPGSSPQPDQAWRRRWFSGAWGQCSASCGPGVQRRTVLCPAGPADRGVEQCGPGVPEPQRSCSGDRPVCPANAADDPNCVDKNKNCHLVVQSRLCHYGYYSDICCRSCLLSQT